MVSYRHIIAALRAKPGALTHLAYRDALWPRSEYRRAFDALAAAQPAREAARTMVGLLALAHDRGVEADLAAALEADMGAGQLPDLARMMQRFTPSVSTAPAVSIVMPALASYDSLLAGTDLVPTVAASIMPVAEIAA